MPNGGKKFILTLVLSEKKIMNETKNHTPPFKLNGRSLMTTVLAMEIIIIKACVFVYKYQINQ